MDIYEITVSGEIRKHDMQEGATLSTLQGLVGGLVQCLPYPVEGVDAWINEEGKYTGWIDDDGHLHEGLPLNPTATRIMAGAGLLFEGDYISGPMILTAYNNEGETQGLEGETATRALALV
jgi:hypothetical protein